jgi:hypothetical protein
MNRPRDDLDLDYFIEEYPGVFVLQFEYRRRSGWEGRQFWWIDIEEEKGLNI